MTSDQDESSAAEIANRIASDNWNLYELRTTIIEDLRTKLTATEWAASRLGEELSQAQAALTAVEADRDDFTTKMGDSFGMSWSEGVDNERKRLLLPEIAKAHTRRVKAITDKLTQAESLAELAKEYRHTHKLSARWNIDDRYDSLTNPKAVE